jgi:hypothetical protein
MRISYEDASFRDSMLKTIADALNKREAAEAKRDGNTVVIIYEDEGIATTQTRFTVSIKVTREPIPTARQEAIHRRHEHHRKGWSPAMRRAENFLLRGK